MKQCVKCGNELNDTAQFCPNCGEKQPEEEKALLCEQCGAKLKPDSRFCPSCGEKRTEKEQTLFCEQCGAKLNPDNRFCPSCGKEKASAQQSQQSNTYSSGWTPKQTTNALPIIAEISKRIKIIAFSWLAIGVLQIICAIVNFYIASVLSIIGDASSIVVGGIMLIVIGAVNIYASGYKDIKFAGNILTKPAGILGKYISINKFVGTLIYNVILLIVNIGDFTTFSMVICIIAVAACILDIMWVRGFVIGNQGEFQNLEQQNN